MKLAWTGIAALVLAALVFASAPTAPAAADPPADTAVSVKQLQGGVKGLLGARLGRCVKVQGRIVRGAEGKSRTGGLYRLQAAHVDGKALPAPIEFEFEPHSAAVEAALPSDEASLLKSRKGTKPAGGDRAEQIRELEQGYVGRTVSVLAYETGGFEGVPEGLPAAFPVWQDHGFSFISKLVVLEVHP